MKKKLLIALLVGGGCFFISCGDKDKNTYKVTFKELGDDREYHELETKEVKDGDKVTLPESVDIEMYGVKLIPQWVRVDYSKTMVTSQDPAIQANLTHAVLPIEMVTIAGLDYYSKNGMFTKGSALNFDKIEDPRGFNLDTDAVKEDMTLYSIYGPTLNDIKEIAQFGQIIYNYRYNDGSNNSKSCVGCHGQNGENTRTLNQFGDEGYIRIIQKVLHDETSNVEVDGTYRYHRGMNIEKIGAQMEAAQPGSFPGVEFSAIALSAYITKLLGK